MWARTPWGTGYSHDPQCVIYRGPDEDYQGREICLGANETALSIADATDIENPTTIAHSEYPSVWATRTMVADASYVKKRGGAPCERTRTPATLREDAAGPA